MCFLSVEGDRVAFHSLGAQHHPQGKLHGFEDRALFYMQLQVGTCMGAFTSCIPDAVNLNLALA
jgi:hypothetical protein